MSYCHLITIGMSSIRKPTAVRHNLYFMSVVHLSKLLLNCHVIQDFRVIEAWGLFCSGFGNLPNHEHVTLIYAKLNVSLYCWIQAYYTSMLESTVNDSISEPTHHTSDYRNNVNPKQLPFPFLITAFHRLVIILRNIWVYIPQSETGYKSTESTL